LNRRPEAIHSFEAALKLDPNRADAHYLLGKLYQKMGRTADSEREIQLSRNQRRQKLQHEEESLLKAAGARGDATQSLDLIPKRGQTHFP
jgi:predicted Zn-dependent protease